MLYLAFLKNREDILYLSSVCPFIVGPLNFLVNAYPFISRFAVHKVVKRRFLTLILFLLSESFRFYKSNDVWTTNDKKGKKMNI